MSGTAETPAPALRWHHLSDADIVQVTDGCGRKGGWMRPPEHLFFDASCDQHDFYYWRGHREADRKIADTAFYEVMKRDVGQAAWYRRPWLHSVAWLYFRAVRIWGKQFFYYGPSYRTREQLPSESGD